MFASLSLGMLADLPLNPPSLSDTSVRTCHHLPLKVTLEGRAHCIGQHSILTSCTVIAGNRKMTGDLKVTEGSLGFH
jgi:hypothetical protein